MKIEYTRVKSFFSAKAAIKAAKKLEGVHNVDAEGSDGVTASQVGKVEFLATVYSNGQTLGPFELTMKAEKFADEAAREKLVLKQPGVSELIKAEAAETQRLINQQIALDKKRQQDELAAEEEKAQQLKNLVRATVAEFLNEQKTQTN